MLCFSPSDKCIFVITICGTLIQAGLRSSWKTMALNFDPLITSVENRPRGKKSEHIPFSTFTHKSHPSTRNRKMCEVTLVHLQISLGDHWVSVHAVLLQRQVVGASTSSLVGAGHDPEPALLPPWLSPGVAYNPVFHTVLHPPPCH